jgi:hypothetical protein
VNALLVLGTMVDPHVEWVVNEIRRREEIPVVVIDYLRDSSFSLNMDSAGDARLIVDDQHLLLKDVVVWDCAKLIAGTPFYLKNYDEHSGYAAAEWRAFYKLICALSGNGCVNTLSSRLCMIKPYQQMIAASVGLHVPATLVTNDKDMACSYVQESHDGTVMKSLSSSKVRPPSEGEPIYVNIMTMRVSEQDIVEASHEEIAYCPHFLQSEILKDYELRVVYVDGVIFSYKIDSQAYKTSEVDWRHGMSFVSFIPFEIDGGLRKDIRSFMERMGLFSGSLDFIVDRQGRPWFLECNQQGAWGWLDYVSDPVISRAFADALTKQVLSVASAGSVHSGERISQAG